MIGARVILACRDMKKCMTVKDELVSQTFNKNVECRQCDLASLKSIKEFVDRFNQGKWSLGSEKGFKWAK